MKVLHYKNEEVSIYAKMHSFDLYSVYVRYEESGEVEKTQRLLGLQEALYVIQENIDALTPAYGRFKRKAVKQRSVYDYL